MTPILILAYLRPGQLQRVLNALAHSNRKIYLFIDRADLQNSNLNESVYSIARSYSYKLNLKIYWSPVRLGVKEAMPNALEWAFKFEEELIIVEDDCMFEDEALGYLDKKISEVKSNVVMVCASSPYIKPGKVSVLSSYPLIWVWATNRNAWKLLSAGIKRRNYIEASLIKMIRNPHKILPICYFLAMRIRVSRNQIQAWDGPIALEMLCNNYLAIIPNINMVQNDGYDSVSSNINAATWTSGFSRPTNSSASDFIEKSLYSRIMINRTIRKQIYRMRLRHVLSPIKAAVAS